MEPWDEPDDWESRWMERTDPGWERAWAALAETHGSPDYEEEGEHWQYMGSSNMSGEWTHCFRHRCYKGDRAYVNVPVQEGDFA